jgi:hypothetical protein
MSSPHRINTLGAFWDRALEDINAPAVIASARADFFSFSDMEISFAVHKSEGLMGT